MIPELQNPQPLDLVREADRTLARLLPRLHHISPKKRPPAGWPDFIRRLHAHFPRLFALYYHLYHGQYDYFYHLEALLNTLAESWRARAADLKTLDADREQHPAWFQSH